MTDQNTILGINTRNIISLYLHCKITVTNRRVGQTGIITQPTGASFQEEKGGESKGSPKGLDGFPAQCLLQLRDQLQRITVARMNEQDILIKRQGSAQITTLDVDHGQP